MTETGTDRARADQPLARLRLQTLRLETLWFGALR